MKIPALLLVVLASIAAGCGSNASPNVTTPSSFVVSASTEVFAGTLSPSGSGFYSFTSIGSDTTAITFGSLTSAASGAPLSSSMRIGVGIPSGTGCGLVASKDLTPALTAQISVPLAAGIFCISITDNTGALAADANFAVRITQGTLTLKSNTSPEAFASNIGVHGSASRTFVLTSTGTVTVTLDSVTNNTAVGFGLGIWRTEKSLCSLNQAVTAGPGAQITALVDQGIYCVKVFDAGNLTDFVAFSSSIVHP